MFFRSSQSLNLVSFRLFVMLWLEKIQFQRTKSAELFFTEYRQQNHTNWTKRIIWITEGRFLACILNEGINVTCFKLSSPRRRGAGGEIEQRDIYDRRLYKFKLFCSLKKREGVVLCLYNRRKKRANPYNLDFAL
jgi:hypothetical protein